MILHQIVERIHTTFSGSEFLAKLSDFEFAILWPSYEQQQSVAEYVAQLSRILSKPMLVYGTDIKVETCFSSSQYPQDGMRAVTLMQNAAFALDSIRTNQAEYYRPFLPTNTTQAVYQTGDVIMNKQSIFSYTIHTIHSITTHQEIGLQVKFQETSSWQQAVSLSEKDPTEKAKLIEELEGLFNDLLWHYKKWVDRKDHTSEKTFIIIPLFYFPNLGNALVEILTTVCFELKLDKKSIILLAKENDLTGEKEREYKETVLFLHEAGFGLGYTVESNQQLALQHLLEYPFDIFLVNQEIISQLTNEDPTRKERLMRSILHSCIDTNLLVIAEIEITTKNNKILLEFIHGVANAAALPAVEDKFI